MTASRSVLMVILLLGLLVTPLAADAQPAGQVYRIGYLSSRPGPAHWDEAFRQGLRELGYGEGTNITVEYRWAAWGRERLLTLAGELIRLKVDLLLTTGGAAPYRRLGQPPVRSRSSLRRAIPRGLGWSPAWRGPAGI